MLTAPDPNGWTGQVAAVGAVTAWMAGLLVVAVLMGERWPGQREWSRKLVHIGAGLVVLIAWWLGIRREIGLATSATVTVVAALNHRFRLLPAVEDVARRSYGTVAYGAAYTLLFGLWWPERADAMAAGVLVMALGDGLAGLVGPMVASPSWRVLGERRSVAGTATMALGSLCALALVAALPGSQPPAPVGLLLIAGLATAIEQVPLLGIDNLSVPAAVAWLWAVLP